MTPTSPPGSETVARHQGRAGNSGDPLGSSHQGGRVARPVNGGETQRRSGSRMSPYERGGGVTPAEQRGTQFVADSMDTLATRRGGRTAVTGVESIATRARSHPAEPFTALMHHFNVDNLRACFLALDGKKAPGVDGVTKATWESWQETPLI